MKNLITLLLLSLISFNYAQSELKVGKPSSIEYTFDRAVDFAKMNNGDIVLASYEEKYEYSKKKRQVISVYNDLKLKKQTVLDHNEYGLIKQIITKGDSIFLLSFHNDKKNKSLNHYVSKAHRDHLNFKKKILYSINKDQFKKYFMVGFGPILLNNGLNQMDTLLGYGDYIVSPNKEFIVIIYDIKNKDNQSNKIILFDKNFNLLFETDYQAGLKDKLFDMKKLLVDDKDGSIYFLGKAYLNSSKKKKKNGKVNYEYRIFKIDKEQQLNSLTIKSKKYIKELELIQMGSELYLAGFYSNIKEEKQQGLYISKVNKISFEEENIKVIPFDDNYIKEASLKFNRKKFSKESDNDFVKNYEIKKVLKLKDELYLISEVKDKQQVGASERAVLYNTFENISVIKLNKELDFTDSKIINRKLIAYRDENNYGLLVGQSKENIHIYFIAQKFNIEGRPLFSNGKNMNTYELVIDSNLNIEEYLHDFRWFQTTNCLITEDEIVSYLTWRPKKEEPQMNLLQIRY